MIVLYHHVVRVIIMWTILQLTSYVNKKIGQICIFLSYSYICSDWAKKWTVIYIKDIFENLHINKYLSGNSFKIMFCILYVLITMNIYYLLIKKISNIVGWFWSHMYKIFSIKNRLSLVHPGCYGGFGFEISLLFVAIICLVPNISCVSGLPILDCSFGLL